jgi:hypothetical protein
MILNKKVIQADLDAKSLEKDLPIARKPQTHARP